MSEKAGIRTDVGALLVGVTALLLFAPALTNGFAYDDVPIILGDPRLPSLDFAGIFTRGYWADADLALYRPLTTLSYALDWQLAPGSTAWYHFVNVLLHAGSSVLVFLLLARLFAAGPALAGGLLFAIHPVHVEAVANVVGRAELLSGAFLLLACLFWARRGERRSIAAPAALFLLAMLSKESAVMLPAALVLVDAATGELQRAGLGAYVRRNAPAFIVLALVLAGWLALRVAVLGGFAPGQVDPILEVAATPAARLFTALQAWPEILRLYLFPAELLADYGPRVLGPANGLTSGAVLGGLILAALLVFGVIALVRGQGGAAMALLWTPVLLLPVSNLIIPIGVLVAERTLYVPSFALAAAVAALAARPGVIALVRRPVPRIAIGVVALLLCVRVLMRIPEWTSTDTVMLALVRDRPESFRGHWHLARMARTAADPATAVAHYDTAVMLWPHRKRLVLEAAGYAAEQRSPRRTYALADLAVRQWPDDAAVQRVMAGAALDAGDLPRAEEAIHAGLALLPGDSILLRMAAFVDSIQARSP